MSYIEDLGSHSQYPCSTVGITDQHVTVNMDSRAGFTNLKSGPARKGVYMDNGNDIAIHLPGDVVGNRQELRFNR
jgi:hypothetical protein